MSIAETFYGYRFAYISGRSIAGNKYPQDKEEFHISRVYTPALSANLSPAEIRVGMLEILESHYLGADLSERFYWQNLPWKEKRRINSLHLFGLSVSFADLNEAEIPDYIIPPKDLFSQYYRDLLSSERPLSLHEQFDQALSIDYFIRG